MSGWLLGLLVLVLAATLAVFVHDTQSVRHGNVDDVANDHLVRTGGLEAHTTAAAEIQGRFYLTTPLHLWPYRLYEIDSPLLFSAARGVLFFAQIGLAGWLCARLARSAAVGGLAVLGGVAALHLPATFFAVLSYPTMAVGFCSLLASLHLHLSHLRRPSPVAALLSGLLLLHACLYLEVFVVYLPLYPALSWQHGYSTVRTSLRSAAAPLAAVVGYLAVYACFTRLHPADYGGTRLGLDPGASLNALARLSFSVIPGCELLVHRTHPAGGGDLLKSGGEVLAALAGTPLWRYGLAVISGLTFGALLWHAARAVPRSSGLAPAVLAGAAVFLPNVPVSITERYQVWVYHREYPYIYSFYSYCALVALAALLLPRLVAPPGRAARARVVVLALLGSGVFASAQASNRVTLGLLRQWHGPAAAAPHVSTGTP
jgi:hypothetical protein